MNTYNANVFIFFWLFLYIASIYKYTFFSCLLNLLFIHLIKFI